MAWRAPPALAPKALWTPKESSMSEQGVFRMNNSELFDQFFKKFIEEKFPGVDLQAPGLKQMKEFLRFGFKGACIFKDDEVKALKEEISRLEVSVHNEQTKLIEMEAQYCKDKALLIKGLKFYAGQKGHGAFEQDGSKKRALGEYASTILKKVDAGEDA
jgi:hypothetical protein